MVSSGDKRNAKYLAKYDAVTVGTRYGLVKDIATGAFAATANTMAMYETQVKNDILASHFTGSSRLPDRRLPSLHASVFQAIPQVFR